MPLVVPEVGALIAVEAIAHVDGERSIVKQSATPANPFWPDAVRVADKLYVSGRYGTGKTFSEQARSIYDAFDAIVRASGVSWHDIVRVHQFGIRPDLSIGCLQIISNEHAKARSNASGVKSGKISWRCSIKR